MGEKNDNDPTVVEGTPTPAPAEPAGTPEPKTEPTSQIPAIADDVWDDLGKEDTTDDDKTKTAAPGAETEKEKEKEKETETKTEEEETDEEKAIREAFEEEDEADEDKTKKAEAKKPETDEEIDKQDPEEMLKNQRNAAARSYLKRAETVYAPTKDFKYDNIEVNEFHDRLADFLGEEKIGKLASYEAERLVDANLEVTFHRIYALKQLAKDPNWQYDASKIPDLDDLIFGNGTKEAEPAAKTASTNGSGPPAAEIAEITRALDTVIDFDWRDPQNDDKFVDDREMKMAQTIRALEAKAAAEGKLNKDLSDKLGNLEKNVEKITETGKTEEQKKLHTELNRVMNEYRKVIEDKITPHIRRTTGLEVSKDDTPEIADFKKRKMDLFLGDEYQRSNGVVSRFEAFAYDESSVGKQLQEATENVVQVQLNEAIANLAGNKADAKKYHDEAKGFLLTFSTLLGKAAGEFRKREVDPDIELLGIRAKKEADPIVEAAKRKETVSTGGGSTSATPKKRDHETADEIWDSMPKEAAEEEKAARAA